MWPKNRVLTTAHAVFYMFPVCAFACPGRRITTGYHHYTWSHQYTLKILIIKEAFIEAHAGFVCEHCIYHGIRAADGHSHICTLDIQLNKAATTN